MAEPSQRYVPALDGLRGIAILIVVAHNSTLNEAHASIVAKLWTGFTDAGWIGVQLFFVLSGYLITGLLLDGRDRPHALRTFYVRRSLRIFPLYYVVMIARVLVVPLFVPALAVGFSTQIWYWLYLSNWSDLLQAPIHGMSHCWSLAVEEQFYLTWPAVVRRLRPRTIAWVCIAIAIGALAARLAFYAAGIDHSWMYSSTVARADALALGALVALGVRAELDARRFARVRRRIGALALAALAVIAAWAHGLSRFNPRIETVGYTLIAVLFAVVVAEIVQPAPHRAWRWLDRPALRLVGRYSYAMYLFHLPLRFIIEAHAGGWLAAGAARAPVASDVVWVLAIAAISFALAALSYVAIERPFLALKDRWAPR